MCSLSSEEEKGTKCIFLLFRVALADDSAGRLRASYLKYTVASF